MIAGVGILLLSTCSMLRTPSARPTIPSASARRCSEGITRMQVADLVTPDLLTAVNAFYQTAPIQAAFLTCGVKASLSDTISQKTVEKVYSNSGAVTEHRFCFSRNFAFLLYGGLYQGVAQHVIFNEIYPVKPSTCCRAAHACIMLSAAHDDHQQKLPACYGLSLCTQVVFGTGTDFQTVASKVLFDQLVLTPLLCLPIAYLVKAVVFRYPLKEGLEKYLADAKKECVRYLIAPLSVPPWVIHPPSLTCAQHDARASLWLCPFTTCPPSYNMPPVLTVPRLPHPAFLTPPSSNCFSSLLWKYWAIWTPTQCLTFSIVPDHLRIPFIAVVSFFWLIILSNITSRAETAGQIKPSGQGKAIICYDNECIVVGEIDDGFDVSVLDMGVVTPTSLKSADTTSGDLSGAPDPQVTTSQRE